MVPEKKRAKTFSQTQAEPKPKDWDEDRTETEEEETPDESELLSSESDDDQAVDDDLLVEEDLGDGEDSDSQSDSDDDSDTSEDEPEPSRPRRRTRRIRQIEGRASTQREDPVKTYLREIGKVPLLTKEQEVELAQAMEKGEWVKAMQTAAEASEELNRSLLSKDRGVSILPKERRAELEGLVKAGKQAAASLGFKVTRTQSLARVLADNEDELGRIVEAAKAAREQLTISNLRLAVSIAKRYMNRGLSFLDLIQEGNMGLMKAVEKFDYTRGFKFSTYATWWIRQAITRAIADQSRTIRVPVHMIETVRELARTKREFIQQYGAAPTLEDLATLTGMSIDKIKKVENVSQYTASLERPIGDEEEDTLGDFIEDPTSPSPTKETFRMFLKEQLNRALNQLDEREREILRLRYGLDDDHPRTLKDVALKFNITRERVRQIEIKAIEKLKHPSRRAELKRFRELLRGEE